MPKRYALISVADKTGVVEFCRRLAGLGFEIISTGGTLRALAQGGVPARRVSDVTGVPEILDGRIKTLHPGIFAAILARRHVASDLATLTELGMEPIDVVAVNLAPVAPSGEEEPLEHIDIGGVALLRAAAKNCHDVYAAVDPADYEPVLDALGAAREADYLGLRLRLAAKVFEHTARYDEQVRRRLQERLSIRPPEGTTSL